MPKKHRIILTLFYIVILWFAIYRAWISSDKFNRGHFSGDSFSEKNVLCAGKHFYENGFIKCRFLPIYESELLRENVRYYTHYPPLPDIINGFLRIIGFKSIFSFRLVSIFLSISMLTMLYFLIKVLLDDSFFALVGTIYTGLTPYFLFFADNLHQHLYNELFMIGAVLFFILFDKEPKKVYILLAWVFAFLSSLTSFERILFLIGFFWGYYFMFKRDWPIKYLFIFSSSVFCGLVLHFAQNVWALGSIKEAFFDLKAAFYYRSIGKSLVKYNEHHINIPLNKNEIMNFISEIIMRIDYFFSIHPIILSSAFCCLCLYTNDKKRLKFYYKILGLCFLLGILWWIFFLQHTVIHQFTGRHPMLFVVMFVTVFVGEGIYYILKSPRKNIHKYSLISFLLMLIICSILFRFVKIYYSLLKVFFGNFI